MQECTDQSWIYFSGNHSISEVVFICSRTTVQSPMLLQEVPSLCNTRDVLAEHWNREELVTFSLMRLIFECICYACTVLIPVEVSLLYVCLIIIVASVEVAQGFVSAHDVGALHTVLLYLCSANTEFHALFPDHLCEVARSSLASPALKIVARFTNFVVPEARTKFINCQLKICICVVIMACSDSKLSD